jgi:F-type H+-transporting ATPase subunit gamma
MPSLKDYRLRIASVKNTRKITTAMKMVAASKLRQAQMRAEEGRPYATKIREALARLIVAIGTRDEPLPLLDGRKNVKKVLIVAVAVDRGLAGGFNSNLVREVKRQISAKNLDNKQVSVITVGRRGRDVLKREFPGILLKHFAFKANFETAEELMTELVDMYEDGKYDVAYVVYSKFKNVITQEPVTEQLIPFSIPKRELKKMQREEEANNLYQEEAHGVYMFEPNAMTLLKRLVPQQLASQIYSVLLEVGAGEQAARMTAMDNASRNAGDMINGLSLQYNRARQAYITKEMSEIVSGVEASA